MRAPRTVSVYVLREVLAYTLLGLLVVSVVFIGQNALRRLNDLLAIGVDPSDVGVVLRAIVGVAVAYTIPISFLFGAFVGVARLASDAELLAMRACGIGLREIVVPIALLGVAIAGLTAYVTLDVEHRAKRSMREAVKSIAATAELIEPQRFNRLGSRTIYVEARDRDNRLEGVFIADQSNPDRPLLIFAASGELRFDYEKSAARMLLRDGDLHLEGNGSGANYFRMAFRGFEYVFPIQLPESLAFESTRPRDMTLAELRGVVARARAGESITHLYEKRIEKYETQIHRRFALPLAPALFGLLVVPLAPRRVRGARARATLSAAMLVAVYYGALGFGQNLAEAGVVPVALGMWAPNAALAVLAVVLLRRAQRVPA